MPARTSRRILRLRVSIADIEPEIWRTIDVDESLTLAQLHTVLQISFNWLGSHLHRFSEEEPWAQVPGIARIGRTPRVWVDAWSLAEDDFGDDGDPDEDDALTTVGEAMQHDGPLWYAYDFGDGWMHRIDLVDRDVARPGEPPAQIVIGERRAPFEDSGGPGGYQNIAEILADPSHEEHGSIAEWVAIAAGPWGSVDLEDPDLEGARGELEALFGPAGDDLSGLVDVATGITADSPIAEFASGLPVPLRSNLRRHLRRNGLLEPRPLADDDVADAVAPFAWLIERIGTEGLTLTKAGWMPPAVVLEGMTALGWRENWRGEANREDITRPMFTLRESAVQLRLIRKVKGRLELVARTRNAIDKPAVLAEQIGRMLLRQRMDEGQRTAATVLLLGLADGSITTRADGERKVVEVMNELGYVDSSGGPLDVRWFGPMTGPVLITLDSLGLWRERSRRRDIPVTDALRAIARLALR